MVTQLFLIASGNGNSYPAIKNNRIQLIHEDPAEHKITSPFVCSPIFSLRLEGYECIPNLNNVCAIGYFIVKDPFPVFGEILSHVTNIECYWFTLGLANLVVFDEQEDCPNITNAIKLISEFGELNANEVWLVKDCTAMESKVTFNNKFEKVQADAFEFINSESLPGYIKFTISEYTISARKILDAASRFTPQYHSSFKRIFDHSKYLIEGLCFLYNDSRFMPSDDIESSLRNIPNSRESIVNEKHGRLIQLNSALSYVYSQTYSGSFPIFDHNGIIRRHSLLGIGGATNGLFEIVGQLEEAFAEITFEEYLGKEYLEKVPSNYRIYEPRDHNFGDWYNDTVRKMVIKAISPNKYIKSKKEYFSRFAFFSGRLGFREYDFSATSAIQVLVASTSLQWNVINYTHEIIHNHVRIILNRILNISNFNSEFYLDGQYHKFIEDKRLGFKNVIKSQSQLDITYSDYFFYVILTYCIYTDYFGSLSQDWNEDNFSEAEHKSTLRIKSLVVPSTKFIVEEIKKSYRDISEIFVHIVDLNYIYKGKVEIYLDSIWSSWATVPAVTNNIRHYILRSLLIIASLISGETSKRYSESVRIFQGQLRELISRQTYNEIFSMVLNLLENDAELRAFKKRFLNCLPIADMASNFFVCDLNSYLNRNDLLVGGTGREVYDLPRGEFAKVKILSKVRLLLEQLNQSELRANQGVSFHKEWESAWLLVCLSSNYKIT